MPETCLKPVWIGATKDWKSGGIFTKSPVWNIPQVKKFLLRMIVSWLGMKGASFTNIQGDLFCWKDVLSLLYPFHTRQKPTKPSVNKYNLTHASNDSAVVPDVFQLQLWRAVMEKKTTLLSGGTQLRTSKLRTLACSYLVIDLCSRSTQTSLVWKIYENCLFPFV